MALIKTLGIGIVESTDDPNNIETLQSGHGFTKIKTSDGTKEWDYYPSNNDGEKWVKRVSYKSYTCLVTQTGTDAPIPTVLSNNLESAFGDDPLWSRTDVGKYQIYLEDGFPQDKTVLFIQGSNDGDTSSAITIEKLYRIDNNTINCIVSVNGSYYDGVLNNTSIEIRVYD